MDVFNVKPILFIISGPSGAGKNTLIQHASAKFPNIIRHVPTYTTRKPRVGETPGVDYRFVSHDQFISLAEKEEIFEWTRTYGDHYYGSPDCLLRGEGNINLLVELDFKGMFRVRESSLLRVVSIFIVPYALDTLAERITLRQREKNMQARILNAEEQIQFAWAYDYILINHDLSQFLCDVERVFDAELLKRAGRQFLVERRHSNDYTLHSGIGEING